MQLLSKMYVVIALLHMVIMLSALLCQNRGTRYLSAPWSDCSLIPGPLNVLLKKTATAVRSPVVDEWKLFKDKTTSWKVQLTYRTATWKLKYGVRVLRPKHWNERLGLISKRVLSSSHDLVKRVVNRTAKWRLRSDCRIPGLGTDLFIWISFSVLSHCGLRDCGGSF